MTADMLIEALEPLTGKPVRILFHKAEDDGTRTLGVTEAGDLLTGVGRAIEGRGAGASYLVRVECERGGMVLDARDVDWVSWREVEPAGEDPDGQLTVVPDAVAEAG